MTLLFRRFSQASPRTHVQYGGSGLGLFISRELTELQGGQVGVASKAGVGSTFAFYVRARRCAPPEDSTPVPALPADKQAKMISPAGLARIQKIPDRQRRPALLLLQLFHHLRNLSSLSKTTSSIKRFCQSNSVAQVASSQLPTTAARHSLSCKLRASGKDGNMMGKNSLLYLWTLKCP